MPEDVKKNPRVQSLPNPENSISSRTEQMQSIINALVSEYGETNQITRKLGENAALGGHNLKRYETWLDSAHNFFRETSNKDLTLTLASEWVLDNYYIIRQALLQINEDLPSGFYNQLPKLTKGPLKGLPRIYAIERAVLSNQNYLLNAIDLQAILVQFQEQVSMTMGELWALPIFLRYSLIETLAHALKWIIHPQPLPNLPVLFKDLSGVEELFIENQAQAGDALASGIVANIILSLRAVSEQSWSDFFESVSNLEQILREDPAGLYSLMDFKTRDLYRKQIETLSFACGRPEDEIAQITLDLTREDKTEYPGLSEISQREIDHQSSPNNIPLHIGEYLLGSKRNILEEKIGYHPDIKTKIRRWLLKHANIFYFGSVFGLTLLLTLALIWFESYAPVLLQAGSRPLWVAVFIQTVILVVPILTVSANLVNWLITLIVKPRILPKLQFLKEIPLQFQTLVVIPALITNREEIDNLTRQVEMHFLRNPEPGLLFALLTDFQDADVETLSGDEELVKYALSAVKKLNAKYQLPIAEVATSTDGSAPQILGEGEIVHQEHTQRRSVKGAQLFYLLHRKRIWNKSESRWMGWERKRGKLHELNQLLRGGKDLSFITITGDSKKSAGLQGVRFVITLDTDTILPRGAASRLIGTLAHPLNRARFSEKTGQVTSGYTVLQPRMEILPRSASHSWFTRIFAGDTGLDLYTRAVSDTYQDLFGEGSYVGKGIYDVDSFEQSVNNRIPENTVLSHDLLEGIMGRAGLVTDITMVEDYPSNYFSQVKRQQRWIRGDWQLIPWLIHPGKFKVEFSMVDRWKMFDNLLRSMLSPALLLIFFIGLVFLPLHSTLWITILLVSLGVPLLTSMARSVMQTIGGENIDAAFHPLKWNVYRWLLAVAFLPYEAYNALDAILTTLYRLIISHSDLLQWTTAAQTARLFGLEVHRNRGWLRMTASSLMAIFLAIGIQLLYGISGSGVAPALVIASPMLLLWMFSPLIAQWINKPILRQTIPLNDEQAGLFRQVARRTWGFFERFVGPEDHWLPPDHFQEEPVGIIAHQTSPSNIGLLLTSTLAAYDFGYLDQLGLATRLSTTIDTLDQLQRFRGHFLNWYDTLTLHPLNPRYISTVDSGNLAASLIITAQATKAMPHERIFRWELWQGYLDTLSNLTETLTSMRKAEFDKQAVEIIRRIAGMKTEILATKQEPNRWFALFEKVNGQFWQDVSTQLIEMVKVGRSAFDLDALRKLQEVAAQVERHHLAILRTLNELVPWIALLEHIPPLFTRHLFVKGLNKLRTNLSYNPVLGRINDFVRIGTENITALREILKINQPAANQDIDLGRNALNWLDAMDQALTLAGLNAGNLIERYVEIGRRSEKYVLEMDFQFLYSPQRRVFHNGFNLDAGQLDNSYYDLLASEARIASIIALAKGEVPQSHWLQLGRPLTRVEGEYVLLSWSATMFEYLMPPLFLRAYPGTLLADSSQGAVLYQMNYGKSKGVPWGISESGFYLFDSNQNYQYRAFGVPGLGFKRGLADDLVVAPYASIMAINYYPLAVAQNLVNLIKQSAFGLYGLYEAIDFTPNRLLVGEKSKVVHEYMAHHQGMVLMALGNYFHKDIMIHRMHNDPRIQSVELLLQEQVAPAVPLQNPYAEDVKGILRLTAAPVEINPWSVPIRTATPQVDLLSNGNYGVVLTNMGGGYSTWRGIDLTRWQPDGVLDPWGSWIYIQDLTLEYGKNSPNQSLWSASSQPVPTGGADSQVTFFAHMAVFRRTENGITSTMEVTVCPDDPVEIRRIHLHNSNDMPRNLRLTSYGEVILTQQVADNRHPAFNKLFIESEFVPGLNLQIFTRRLRSSEETPVFMGHMLVVEKRGLNGFDQPAAWHEADRNSFIGRGRTFRRPAALDSEQYLTGTSGATLDPIFAIGQNFKLNPHESIELAYLTFAADSREAILALATRYSGWALIDRSFHQANIASQTWLGKENYDSRMFKDTLQVLSALIYPVKDVRTSPDIIAANHLGQSGLWRFGISGDYPILLVELEDPKHVDLVREILQIYEFLRSRRFMVDVVILNFQQTEYGAEMTGMLYRLVDRLNFEHWLNKRGGIFILHADQINPEERDLIQTAARFIFKGDKGTLDDQMPEYPIQVHHLPDLIPTRLSNEGAVPGKEDTLSPVGRLEFFNGYGGFTRDGREYIIEHTPGKPTPAPWVNVIGYPNFGFMVSETGSQSTWAINSGENRLTPWSNDPVTDPTGEALYLRDEETGDVWTPTPLPAGSDLPYRVIHGAGYSTFEHSSHGLHQWLTLFASPEDPVKIIHLRVKNTWDHTRRITATQYIEWVLGTTHAESMPYIIPEYDASEACLMASNPSNADFSGRTAFLIGSKQVHGLTGDRTEFLGRGGTLTFPAALRRIGLDSRLTPGEDQCAVLQLHMDLLPGATEEIYFVLGQGNSKEHALALAKKYHDPAHIGAALERTKVFWDHLLDTVQVKTPEPAANLILNRWMLYQSLSCRIWGRTAFYQPGGAFGFRDQLQDVLALLPIDPAISRAQILNAAQRQFVEGDVLHWWHPPSGRGVKTRISDDLLWLPYVVAQYIETTGDTGILQEKVPFLDALPLNRDETERYNKYSVTKKAFPLLEHCLRAIGKGSTFGPNGLPLIGTGDWNDGLNRVGVDGKGESVWLAWFLCDVLERFAGILDKQGDSIIAKDYRLRSKKYAAAVERSAWDGKWYRRAYYDDGSPLGSILEPECQIDGIAQSWSVLSGAGDPIRSRQAMKSVTERLVRSKDRLSLLFTPPFDKTLQDPGYIKGYLPGIRENGGQYSHAAAWTAWAFAKLGDGKQAGELFNLLNPILQSDSKEKAERYRVEPYVMSADIYSTPPYLRRGGWTWYSGSSAWVYRLGLEGILGFLKIGNTLRIDPVIPPKWKGFEIRYLFGKTYYQIKVSNPTHIEHGVHSVILDGKILNRKAVQLVNDGKEHLVEVLMGNNNTK